MNFSSNIKKDPEALLKLLDELSDPTLWSSLSSLEKDLARDKLRRLYEHIGYEESQPKGKKKSPSVVKENQQSGNINPASVDEHIHQSESDPHEIEMDDLISAHTEEKNSEPEKQSSSAQPDLFTSPEKKKEAGPADVPKPKVDEKPPESIAEKIHKEVKIDRLKTAIGINEKFFFINELFDGNLNVYNEAIDALDRSESPDRAKSLFAELSENHRWKEHQEAKEQLWQFIERKFK